MVLVVVSLLLPVAERFRLPHTVLLAIAGMEAWASQGSWLIDQRRQAGRAGRRLRRPRQAGGRRRRHVPAPVPATPAVHRPGLNIEVRRLMDEVHAVLLLAIVAVVVCPRQRRLRRDWATGMDLVGLPAAEATWCRPPIRPPSSASSAASAPPSDW